MTTKKSKLNTFTQPTLDEECLAMNEIVVLLDDNNVMYYEQIQAKFTFIVSGILLEMEMVGLIKTIRYNTFTLA